MKIVSLKPLALCLCTAFISQSAFAEITTNVAGADITLFGTFDASIESVGATGATLPQPGSPAPKAVDQEARARAVGNSSDLGVKGQRALGNSGLKGIFQIGFGLDGIANNSGVTSFKDSFVGLAGSFGSVKFGLNPGAGKNFGGKIENNYGATTFAEGGVLYNQIGGTKTKGGDRAKNSLVYSTPSLSGFTANLLYGSYNNDNAPADVNFRNIHSYQVDFWADYAIGDLLLDVSLMNLYNPQLNGASPGAATCTSTSSNFCLRVPGAATSGAGAAYNDKIVMSKLGAVYKLPSGTRLHALYDRSSYEVTADAGSVKRERNSWQIGVLQNFGQNNVWAQFGANAAYKDNGVKVADTGAKYLNLGYSYDLDKNTLIRVYFARVTNEAKVAYDFTTNPVSTSGNAAYGVDPQGIGFGLRYKF